MKFSTILASATLAIVGSVLPASAGLTAYEPFNYSTGAGALTDGLATTGAGFSGNWTVKAGNGGPTSANFVAGLSYPSLPTANNAASSGGDKRSLNPLAAASTSGTVWVSALMQGTGNPGGDAIGLVLGGTAANSLFVGFAAPFSGSETGLGLGATATGGAQAAVTSFTNGANISNSTTHLLVIKADLTANTFDLFIDPTAGQPTAPAATISGYSLDIGDLSSIGFQTLGGTTPIFDEFRVGTSFEDVVTSSTIDGGPAVPEPTTLGLLGIGALGLLARRRTV